MASWLGQMGGLGILALAGAILGRFCQEIGWIRDGAALKAGGRAALAAMIIGAGYLTLGGAYAYMIGVQPDIGNFQAVWGAGYVKMYLAFGMTALGAAFMGRAVPLMLPFGYWLFIHPVGGAAFLALGLAYRFLLPWRLPDRLPFWVYPPVCVLSAFALMGGL